MAVYKQGISLLRNIINQTALVHRTDTRHIKRWVSPTLRELKRRQDKLGEPPVHPRSTFLEWNFNAELYAFGKRLNEPFDTDLLHTALTNSSYVNKARLNDETGTDLTNIEENTGMIQDGDSFIVKSVAKQLRNVFPKFPDDGIKSACRYLTRNESLANVALHIGLKDLVLCAEYPPDITTLSDSFKAIVAALCRSADETRAFEFIYDFVVLKQLVATDINEMWPIEKPFEMLNQLIPSELEPRLCNHSAGNTILAAYQVGLYSNKKLVGIGWGESTDIAIEMAARDGLKRLFGTTDSMPAVSRSITPAVQVQRSQVHN